MGVFKLVWTLFWRAVFHGIAVDGLAHLATKSGLAPTLEATLEGHLVGFMIMIFAGTLLHELLLTVTAPDLWHPCNGENPMLPLEDDDK